MWLLSDHQQTSPMAARSASVRLCWAITCSGTGAHAALGRASTSMVPSSCAVTALVASETPSATVMSHILLWSAAMMATYGTMATMAMERSLRQQHPDNKRYIQIPKI